MKHFFILLLLFWDNVEFTLTNDVFRLKLVGGQSRCRGQLQVQRSGQDWTGVDPGFVPLSLRSRLCAALGCGSVLRAEGKSVSSREAVYLYSSRCVGTSLSSCFYSDSHRSSRSLELICSDSVRLVSGRNSCSGSVQIRDQSSDRSWTRVCEGALDRRGAEVLCRELCCGAPVLQGELSPLGQMFQCQGNEAALMDCPRDQTWTNPGTCFGPTLHLTCSEPLRLVGGASRCEGAVEAEFTGKWRRVWTLGSWGLEDATVVCQGLGCGYAVSTEQRGGFNRSDVWFSPFDCVKKTSSVRDCIHFFLSDDDRGLHVVCSEFHLRLVGGQSRCQGQLEVKKSGQDWTGVGDSFVPLSFGNRVCAELDCGSALGVEGKTVPNREVFPVSHRQRLCQDSAHLIHCFGSDARPFDRILELNCSGPLPVNSAEICGHQKKGNIRYRERVDKACESALTNQSNFVYLVILEDANFGVSSDAYTMRIEKVVKNGTYDTNAEGQLRKFISFSHCRRSLNLQQNKGYLIIGKAEDTLPDASSQSFKYLLGERTWIEFWPRGAECLTEEHKPTCLGTEALIDKFKSHGCVSK